MDLDNLHIDNNKLYVSVLAIAELGFNTEAIRVSISQNRPQYADIIKKGRGKKALYLVESLPEHIYELVFNKLLKDIEPAVYVEQQLAKNAISQYEEGKNQLISLYDAFCAANRQVYASVLTALRKDEATSLKSEEFRDAFMWYTMLANVHRTELSEIGFSKMPEFMKAAIEAMAERMPERKGRNANWLRYHVFPHFKGLDLTNQEAIMQALKHVRDKRGKTANAAKLKPKKGADKQQELMQAKLIELKGCPAPKLSHAQVHQAYMRVAREQLQQWHSSKGTKGWDERCLISLKTVTDFLNQPHIKQEWFVARNSKKEYNDHFEKVTRRHKASFANAKWVIDGTPWHRYFQHEGYAYQRLNVFVVLDAHSWAVVGFYVSVSEHSGQVVGALRNACRTSKYLPIEIQYDNSSAIKSYHAQRAINAISKYGIAARPGNARSKKVEPFFKHFNDRVLKFWKGYTGNPFRTLDTRANKDELMRQIKAGELPTYDTAINDLLMQFEQWNTHQFSGAIPKDKYFSSLENNRHLLASFTDEIDVDAFWYLPTQKRKTVQTDGKKRLVHTPQLFTFSTDGFGVNRDNPSTGEKEYHRFDTTDANFNSRHIGQQFELRCEPENMERCLLYQDNKPYIYDGKHVAIGRAVEISEAIADRQEGEGALLQEQYSSKEQQNDIVKSRFELRIADLKTAGLHQDGITHEDVYGKNALTLTQIRANEELNAPNTATIEEEEPPIEQIESRYTLRTAQYKKAN